MDRRDLSEALSLSCVENYYLAYFKDKFDIEKVYVESFIPFNNVMEDFLRKNSSYENYTLTRVQDTAEKLGLTEHEFDCRLQADEEDDKLTLISVNKRFFENFKFCPWREDHYIAVRKGESSIDFLNNYPLSEGQLSGERAAEIFGGRALKFYLAEFDRTEYERAAKLQFDLIFRSSAQTVRIDEENLPRLRNAILVLKMVRKRVARWLCYENKKRQFFCEKAETFLSELLSCYERVFVAVQVQMTRGQVDVAAIQGKADRLAEYEGRLCEIFSGGFKWI